MRTSAGVARLRRDPDGVEVTDVHGRTERFDQVILACHSDQALRMLEEPEAAVHPLVQIEAASETLQETRA